MDRALIEQFAAGPEQLAAAVRDLSPADLDAHPGPGEWSIRELVVHVVDSDLVGQDRMKRIIAEENPTLLVFDENRWLAELHPGEQSLEDALTLFTVSRRQFARILRALPDAAFDRRGTHSVKGPQTLAQVLAMFTRHLEHHLEFLRQKRERLGK